MTERKNLLQSIATTIGDYRQGDVIAPDPAHVEKWIQQFEADKQVPILRELDHVLGSTYISRKKAADFLAGLYKTKDLVGDDPCKFWKGVSFLNIQEEGASQQEMLALFDKILEKRCGFATADCGNPASVYMYLDDGVFTGNRVRRDLEKWIKDQAPSKAALHVVVAALHAGGQFYANKQIVAIAGAAKKEINIKWWRAVELEDRKYYTNSSDVLRPVAIPDDELVTAYVEAMDYAPHLRKSGQVGGLGLFSSDDGRQILEQEFLKAGVKIRKMCPLLGKSQRPLGHTTLDTLGFGSLIVTFRNCPNNAPLALWAGTPWHPLFARSTNSDTSLKRLLAALAKDDF